MELAVAAVVVVVAVADLQNQPHRRFCSKGCQAVTSPFRTTLQPLLSPTSLPLFCRLRDARKMTIPVLTSNRP